MGGLGNAVPHPQSSLPNIEYWFNWPKISSAGPWAFSLPLGSLSLPQCQGTLGLGIGE